MHDEVYHQYDRVLDGHWWTHNRRQLASWALERAGIVPGSSHRILELGSGVGTELEFLSQYGSVTGVELSPVGLGYCKRRGYDELVEADLNDFEPEPASYDLIVDFHVLYHEWIVDPLALLRRLRHGLTPNGVLLTTEPGFECLRREHDRSVMGGRRFSLSQLKALLAEAGFAVERATAFTSLLGPALLAVATYERLRPRPTASTEVYELEDSPRVLKAAIHAVMAVERRLLRSTSMPFGASVLAISRPQRDA